MIKAATRQYHSQDEVGKRLELLVREMRKDGNLMLPSERVLSERLLCSRETLRRILERYEVQGAILKRKRGRVFSLEAMRRFSMLGRLAFVAEGVHEPGNPAWNKLWNELKEQASLAHVQPQLFLLPHGSHELPANIGELPDLVVYTPAFLSPDMEVLLKQPGRLSVCTDEQLSARLPVTITMDNYAAGRLAATVLAGRGYRQPAFIGATLDLPSGPYVAFQRREEGFRAGCRQCGLAYGKADAHWIGGGSTLKHVIQIVRETAGILGKGYDSVFFYSDPYIGYFLEVASELRKIPEELGIVTVNSFSLAVNHQPPIDSTSHATHATAAALVDVACDFYENGRRPAANIMVPPRFHEGATLRKKVEKKAS
jgi:DNA-binding LacI/PurR family transcriptional regulator